MQYQEMFDKALSGVLKQGCLSREPTGPAGAYMCRYRSTNGAKCSVGHLIEDDHLAHRMDLMDGSSIMHIVNSGEFDEVLPHFINKDTVEFITEMQCAHDYADNVERFLTNMREIASRWGLTMKKG